MSEHLSEKLLAEIQKEQFNSATDKQLVFIIREYFCKVYRDAITDEICARNKKIYTPPNFEDK